MIDRVLLVTRKISKRIDTMQEMISDVHRNICSNDEFQSEAEELWRVMAILREFEGDIEDLEHVILAEGVR